MESPLLSLPGEIRNHIYDFVLPSESEIGYKCSPDHHQLHRPAHRRCGFGPAWLCERTGSPGPSQFGICTINQQVAREVRGLLYDRVFAIEIWDEIFFANSCDWEFISSFPFASARGVALRIHVPRSPQALGTRLRHIKRLEELWYGREWKLSRITFWYDDDIAEEAPPDPKSMLQPLLDAIGLADSADALISGENACSGHSNTFKADYIEYCAYR